jgi:peroxiredoxin/DNA-binding transcriptional MerR regulator
MRISELARRADVTVKAVRYYESLGLLVPTRLGNGYRDYGEQHLRAVRELRELTRCGLRLERTKPFLECLASGGERSDDCPSSLAAYRDAIDDLTERIDALSQRRVALTDRLHAAAHRTRARSAEAVTPSPKHDPLHLPTDLPVPQDDGAAEHLPGLPMPQLALTDTQGETVQLNAMGPGRHVLYLYPLTGRPEIDVPEGWNAIPGARGCTLEACGFRDHHRQLIEAGAARVLGLSSQDTPYQAELVERLRLPFRMLSDSALHLADALGLPSFHAAGARLYKRLTLIVRDDNIEHVFYPIFPPNEHAQQVLTWLRDNPA